MDYVDPHDSVSCRESFYLHLQPCLLQQLLLEVKARVTLPKYLFYCQSRRFQGGPSSI